MPKDAKRNEQTFLGCTYRSVEVKTATSKKTARGIEFGMRSSVRRCVDKYAQCVKELTGRDPDLCKAPTPFLDEDTKHAPQRAPFTGGIMWNVPPAFTPSRWTKQNETRSLRERPATLEHCSPRPIERTTGGHVKTLDLLLLSTIIPILSVVTATCRADSGGRA